MAVNTKYNPIHSRDLKISIDGYTLYVRFGEGIVRDWCPADKSIAELPASELLELHDKDITCRNAYVHGCSRTGVFIKEAMSMLKNRQVLLFPDLGATE